MRPERRAADAAQSLAEACARTMWADDRASAGLGMAIERVRPGEAVLAMTVAEHMTNGHGTCHGGFMFALADSAFAFACNTYDQRTVAQHCAVTYIRSPRRGQRLTAHAVERSRTGRSGIYDVTVTDDTGAVVAEFRGHSRTVAGTILGDASSSRPESLDLSPDRPDDRLREEPGSPAASSARPDGPGSPRMRRPG